MDSATRYSQLLQTIPSKIVDYANTLQQQQHKSSELSSPLDNIMNKKTTPDLSILSDDVLDIPINEVIQEVQTLSKSIQTQYDARMNLLQQLYTCKCNFGSKTAAKEYYNVQEMLTMIQKKKEILEDAMELEGVDIEDIKKNSSYASSSRNDDDWKELTDFDWYTKEENGVDDEKDEEIDKKNVDDNIGATTT